MGQLLKNQQGQGVIVQYALTFALVVAVTAAMSVYFKRVVQGRFAGARDYAGKQISDVFASGEYNLVGRFAVQYEPYYTERVTETDRSGVIVDRDIGTGVTGIQSREYEQYQTILRVQSNQLAPKDAY